MKPPLRQLELSKQDIGRRPLFSAKEDLPGDKKCRRLSPLSNEERRSVTGEIDAIRSVTVGRERQEAKGYKYRQPHRNRSAMVPCPLPEIDSALRSVCAGFLCNFWHRHNSLYIIGATLRFFNPHLA